MSQRGVQLNPPKPPGSATAVITLSYISSDFKLLKDYWKANTPLRYSPPWWLLLSQSTHHHLPHRMHNMSNDWEIHCTDALMHWRTSQCQVDQLSDKIIVQHHHFGHFNFYTVLNGEWASLAHSVHLPYKTLRKLNFSKWQCFAKLWSMNSKIVHSLIGFTLSLDVFYFCIRPSFIEAVYLW